MTAPVLDLASIRHDRRGVGAVMGEVMLALIPGTLLFAWLIDPRVLANVALAVLAALVLEALVLRLRARRIGVTLADGSIALAAWLLALAVPPGLPAGQLLVGVAAMVLLGKHLYGGLGFNPFNPAMVGYAVLIVSFPITMTSWPAGGATPSPPALERTVEHAPRDWDALSGATPLDRLRTLERAPGADGSGAIEPGAMILSSAWPWVNGGFLVGGLWLLARRVIGWRIPAAVLGTLGTLHALHGLFAATAQAPVLVELFAGAAMLGAFFIATDPVSAASGPRARLAYGAGIGGLTFTLREFGAYPEGIAFAVLLMNLTVPLLDRLSGAAGTPR